MAKCSLVYQFTIVLVATLVPVSSIGQASTSLTRVKDASRMFQERHRDILHRAKKSRKAGITFECYPNATILVNYESQLELNTIRAFDSSGGCRTYEKGHGDVIITGCNMDEDITLILSSKEQNTDSIIGGHDMSLYMARCKDITAGFSRNISVGFLSERRNRLSNKRIAKRISYKSAKIKPSDGSMMPKVPLVQFSIDVPVDYLGLPINCVVDRRSDESSCAVFEVVHLSGCSLTSDLLGDFPTDLDQANIDLSDGRHLVAVCEVCSDTDRCPPLCGLGILKRALPISFQTTVTLVSSLALPDIPVYLTSAGSSSFVGARVVLMLLYACVHQWIVW